MIRELKPEEIKDVLDIWLKASIKAHSFVDQEFWKSKTGVMRETYLPSSETYILKEDDVIKGFFSLQDETLAAMFEGKGVGRKLMDKAKTLRGRLELAVYKENQKSIDFYKKCGFEFIEERVDEHTGHMEILMKFGS